MIYGNIGLDYQLPCFSKSFPDLFLSAQQEYILLKLIYVYHYILNISYETRLIQSERTKGIKSTLQPVVLQFSDLATVSADDVPTVLLKP